MTPHHRPDRLVSTGRLADAPLRARPRQAELLDRLLGPGRGESELPPVTDLLATLLALAEGTRRKALLPLSSSTAEFALVRRGEQVLVSYYDGGSVPQIFVRDRGVDLRDLLDTAAAAAIEGAELGAVDAAGLAIAERARRTSVQADAHGAPTFVTRRGGAQRADDAPLAFGFSLKLAHGQSAGLDLGTRADVHALLFDGELWAFAHGRRISLVRGAVFPAVLRMLSAARAAVEAWEAQRPVHLKLKASEFGIALRLTRGGEARMTLMGAAGDAITLPALALSSALSPILRLSHDLVRTVVRSDRAQSKNLRLAALREEVRALRRIVRARASSPSFTNRDPELLRASSIGSAPREPAMTLPEASGRLRLALRWRAEVDGLDASSTFLCGDRIVVASPRAQLALSRDDGELLWMREAAATTTLMVGTSLLSANPDGELALSSLDDGEVYARTRIAPRLGGPLLGTFGGVRGAPPLAVLTEGRDRLVAIDVRTGAPRWSFRSAGRGDFRLARAGRILLVVSGDGTLDAIDVSTGEVVWRWSDAGRFTLTPAVTRDHAVAVAQEGPGAAALLCFDLFSGQLIFKRALPSAPLSPPLASDALAMIACQGAQGSAPELVAHDLASGRERFRADDPGLAERGAPLIVDQHLVVNAPSGCVSAVELSGGALRWQHRLLDPARDDSPRRFEPVLRGGALFVPSASVHVVRPSDGALIGGPIAERVIPDFMRVDERGWLYVGEESGMIEAHAPVPTLRLVKS